MKKRDDKLNFTLNIKHILSNICDAFQTISF